jgi:hydroxypyruvate reductase
MTANPDSAKTRPVVLTYPMGGLVDCVAGAGFEVVTWPRGEGADQRLLELAPRIEAIATIGPVGLPDGFLERASRLGLICCQGAGYERYDPELLKAHGVRLTNGAGLNAEDVADLGWGLYLAAARRIVEADALVRSGKWGQPVMARRVRGRKLAVLGLGAIGHAMALRGEVSGMEVGWWGPNPKPVAWERFSDPMELARWADVLAVCARPTPENENIVGEAMLTALGPEGVLVNVARGSLVDEEALIAALRSGRIAAAALDVFAEEPTDHRKWADVPNLTLHPHSGGATYEAIADGRNCMIENLRRHFAGEPLLTPVN